MILVYTGDTVRSDTKSERNRGWIATYILYTMVDTYLAFWLGRLAFVSDGVSKSMADLRPKGSQLRLGHLQVGELLFFDSYALFV